MHKHIVILDTGKEWGGGTNSLIELVRRLIGNDYSFSAIFFYNYRKGHGPTIGDELHRLGVSFVHLPVKRQNFLVRGIKEIARALLFPSRPLKRRAIFWIDFYTRLKAMAGEIEEIMRSNNFSLLYMNNQPSSNIEGILAMQMEGILAGQESGMPVVQHARSNAQLLPAEVALANRHLTRMICVSEGIRESYEKQGIRQDIMRVVYNGIDVATVPSTPPDRIRRELDVGDGQVVIVMVGALLKRKGFDIFIGALKHLRESRHPFKGVIVGDGPEGPQLRKLARDSGIEDLVHFSGFKPDALSYINACNIFVLSSLGEGLPRVILEAMLMGKPVVASEVTGSSELVLHGETGFLVPPGHPERFARALSELLEDPELRSRMGAQGRERVIKHFSIEKYVSGVEAVFNEVLGL